MPFLLPSRFAVSGIFLIAFLPLTPPAPSQCPAGSGVRGSSIHIARTEVCPGTWETSAFSVHFKGQLLFLKTIAKDTEESRTEYLRVPSDLTAHTAISYLKNPNRLP